MKKIYLLLLIVFGLITTITKAQVSLYAFTESTEVYSPVSGTNSTAIGDDGSEDLIPIGFNFIFGGTGYSIFSISTNGFIRLGTNIGSSSYTNFLNNTTPQSPLIAPFWGDNNRNTGAISYALTGIAPNRILEVGWNNINIGGGGTTSSTNFASYKLRLYETTNNIEFVYGSTMAAAGFLAESVGLNDNSSFLSVTPGVTSAVSSITANNAISSTTNLAGKKFTFTSPPPPACIVPLTISADAITINSSNILFSSAGTSFIVEYGFPGFTPGTGATAGVGGYIVTGSTSPISITGLSSATTYQVYVRQNCTGTGNGYSANSGAISFTTLCSSTNVPYVESFNGITPPAIPTCITFENTNADASTWRTITGLNGYPTISTNAIGYQYNVNGITAANDWFFTQGINLVAGTSYTVRFNYLSAGFTEKMKVVIGPAANAASMATGNVLFDHNNIINDSYTDTSINFTVLSNAVYYFGFQVYSNPDQGWLVVDNINIDITPACSVPGIVAVGAITTNSANTTWSGTGTFILEYGLTGFTPGIDETAGVGGTIINMASSPQALTGLSASSTYEVYVRKDCMGTGGGYSINSSVVSFSTLLLPPVNNECITATTIGAIDIFSTTIGATQSMAAESCGFISPVANDTWYKFTTVSNGSVTVNLTNAGVSLDAIIHVYSGVWGALTNIGCADATLNGGSESVSLTGLLAGQTYFVRVYGWDVTSGTFNISVSGGTLPLSVEYFKGTKQNNGHLIDWKITCASSPFISLVLERSSDGRRFTSISSQSVISARCLQPFSFLDASPMAGINYYRLKSIDIDGKITYSTTVALLNKDKGFEIISIMPNPVRDEAILNITSAVKSIIEIVVSDFSGKQLNKQRINIIAGNNQLVINVSKLPAGSYQVTGINAEGELKTLHFIKQ